MLKIHRTVIGILLLSTLISSAFGELPKYEFRGAWIATVANLDWPTSRNLSVESQKAQLITLLDRLSAAGINAVIFQVRPECDALYNSAIEPWSYWLTGQQGRAPNPLYDPLEFAIGEAHKRGMELHAWFNPYRAVKTVGAYTAATNHVSVQHPDWVLTVGSLKILDPGLPQVRDFVTSVIRDVVERYAIDAIHFDDYFYPYEGITTQDAATFTNYSRGFTVIDDWRRDNVNLFVRQIHEMLQVTKPWVKFGISPFGIWKSGVPGGIIGMSAYSAIYCDALAWLQAGTVDYLAPQCYWKIGGSQDYSKLVPWWAEQTAPVNRHLYPGQIFRDTYSASELPNQVRINRATDGVQGNILFRAAHLSANTFGFADSLKTNFHKWPAITPGLVYKDQQRPNPPRAFIYHRLTPVMTGFSWQYPETAADGDSATRFVLYRIRGDEVTNTNLQDPTNILKIIYAREFLPTIPDSTGPYTYLLTALDANSNESAEYEALTIAPSQPPVPEAPSDLAANVRDTTFLRWAPQSCDAEYEVVYSPDSNLVQNLTVISHYHDTLKMLTGLEGQTTYYWKVRGANAGGRGEYCTPYSFTTGFPPTPVRIAPQHTATDVSLIVKLLWQSTQTALGYRLQIAKSTDFSLTSLVFDSAGLPDTAFTLGPLEVNRTYYWRLQAHNQYGKSNWTTAWRFKTAPTAITGVASLPAEYYLSQNFPNPFNALTTFEFKIGREEQVSITIYDLHGQLIKKICDAKYRAGTYQVQFDGSELSSGFYFVQMQAGKFRQTHKIVLLK